MCISFSVLSSAVCHSFTFFVVYLCVIFCVNYMGLETVHMIEGTNQHYWLFESVVLVNFCSECTKKLAVS